MTAVDQDAAADEAARHINRLLYPFVPDASRWALCLQIVEDLQERYWRCWPPAPPVIEQRKAAPVAVDDHTSELDAARERCAAASDKHHRKEQP